MAVAALLPMLAGVKNAPAENAHTYIHAAANIFRAAEPVIGYTPGHIAQSVEAGQSTSSVIRVWNCGGGMLEYSLEADSVDWLVVPPGSHGQLADDPANEHVVTFAAAGLACGVHTGRIAVVSSNALYPEREVVVELTVLEAQVTASGIPFAWLRDYDLPTDGSVDHLDLDDDGHTVWQEWRAGTDPRDPECVLRIDLIERWNADEGFVPLSGRWPAPVTTGDFQPTDTSGSGARIWWRSVTNREYSVERATNLTSREAFSNIEKNIPGQFGHTVYTDWNVPTNTPVFYRIVVEDHW
jgi:hypothetical protein